MTFIIFFGLDVVNVRITFAAPAVLKDVVTWWTRAGERARSVYTRVLAQEV